MLAASVFVPTAQAAPNGSSSSLARTSDNKIQTAAAAEQYWTEERMASAIPAQAPATVKAATPHQPSGRAGSIEGVAPSVKVANQQAQGIGTMLNESQTVGKVFFTNPQNGLNYVCSGATVSSGKRKLVQTAGHCVHGGAGGTWMSNWAFVPRYRNGVRPFGTWSAYTLTTRTAWINSSNLDEDMGIVVMNTLGGQSIANVVGGNGLRWNWGYSVFVTILGYPAGPPFTGELQYFCQGTTWNGHGQQVRAWCNMTGGSSGGPWLQEYNDQNGLGYINSVVSHRHADPNQMDGPYFDNDIKSLYDFAESLSP
ncbi:trypsin-like serine peptidase [Lentzea sp. JNUCC 0626]|uniref:trypsin-like serine peptidase n=1 Tax=Lentzea sp. JNUCC 0626 TaxID=3367513 RepID=UPI00374A6B9A